jgi:hypothetical protein
VITKLAREAATPGRIAGKTSKTIFGTRDTFRRLRVGDRRNMYDVLDHERIVLVLGIVDRADLERWIRNR